MALIRMAGSQNVPGLSINLWLSFSHEFSITPPCRKIHHLDVGSCLVDKPNDCSSYDAQPEAELVEGTGRSYVPRKMMQHVNALVENGLRSFQMTRKNASSLETNAIGRAGSLLCISALVFYFCLSLDFDSHLSYIRRNHDIIDSTVDKYTRLNAEEKGEESTCRIRNACLSMSLDSYEVILPNSMLLMQDEVLNGCKNGGINFRVADQPASAVHHDADLLLGFFPNRRSYSLAHFILAAGVLIDMAETVLGNRSGSREQFKFENYFRLDDGEWTGYKASEPSVQARRSNGRLALLVDPQVRDDGLEKAQWISSFAMKLLKTSKQPPLFLSPPRDNTTKELHCFRSIWTPPRFLDSREDRHLAHYTVLEDMGVNKHPRDELCSESGTLKVKILNRETTRSIVNVEELKKAARRALEPHFKNVDMKEITFDESSFEDQVAAMQDSDVLIAAHGAAIANALFLREKSLLLEISPFCYNFAGFQKGETRSFDIQSSFVVSGPDFKSYNDTIERWCHKDDSCDYLRNKFNTLAGFADMEKVQKKIRKFTTYKECAELSINHVSNRGLKAQTLNPEPDRVYGRLKPWAEARCTVGTDKPTLTYQETIEAMSSSLS